MPKKENVILIFFFLFFFSTPADFFFLCQRGCTGSFGNIWKMIEAEVDLSLPLFTPELLLVRQALSDSGVRVCVTIL